MRKLLVTLLLILGSSPAIRAGVDGQWEVSVPGSATGLLLEFKSDGNRVTGSLSGPNGKLEIVNGSIAADTISFETVLQLEGRTITVSYTGRISGDAIELTAHSTEFGAEQPLTAKRRDPNAPPPDWFSENPAPDEVLAWLKANAIRLASVQPGSSFADMAPLLARLKDARVVAMGEATHGTREFQQFKHRMLEFLVENLGFTVFGIEANWPESLSVNEYVLGGKSDPVDGLGFRVWQTEEVLEMVRWMRQYNQDPAHARKLKFYGFDMQTPGLAESNVLEYLRRVDPEYRETAAQTFAVLGSWGENQVYENASAEVKRRTAASPAAMLGRFDERKREYIRRSSQDEFAMARQNMAIVKQAEVKIGNQNELGRASRDRAMAENVKWILDQEPPGTKMMLWAHNGHVAAEGETHPPMGAHLREIFGERAVLCGFVFEEGGFRAVDMATNATTNFSVGPAPRGSLDATLAATGLPLFAVDLRHLPEGKVAAWFDAPHRSRQIGAGYSAQTPGVWLHQVRAARAFDLLIFVGKTTPSRPL
ncbi:MAG: erythromycin esterase family protein [Bryobacteraceae bacterium]|jgi:erythromycin esterase